MPGFRNVTVARPKCFRTLHHLTYLVLCRAEKVANVGTTVDKVERVLPEEKAGTMTFGQTCVLLAWLKAKCHTKVPDNHYLIRNYNA